jgi:hypothetical protein
LRWLVGINRLEADIGDGWSLLPYQLGYCTHGDLLFAFYVQYDGNNSVNEENSFILPRFVFIGQKQQTPPVDSLDESLDSGWTIGDNACVVYQRQ